MTYYKSGSDNANFGDLTQEIVIKYLREVYDWKWLAGERNSKVINEKEFSFLKNFSTVVKDSGTRLMFEYIDDEGWKTRSYILMPDELFISKSGNKEFVEVKGRRDEKDEKKYFYEDVWKINQYSKLKREHFVPVWLTFCIKFSKGYNIYFCDVDEAISLSTNFSYYDKEKEKYIPCYRWNSPKGFIKLNVNGYIPLNYLEL